MGRYKKGNKVEITRRELFQHSSVAALGFGKASFLAATVFDGIFNKALAQTTGVNKSYIYFQQYGAPSRWTWDLPLTPDGDMSKFIPCKSVGTRYKDGSRYTELEYRTVEVNGLHMPWMWGFDIPTPGGGWAPMANLMDGLMIMRGASSTNPGHSPAATLHYRPLGSQTSINALAADVSSVPVAGVAVSASQFEFRSRKKYSASSLTYGGTESLIEKFMKPFTMENLSQFESDEEKIKVALNASLSSLDGMAKFNNKLAENIEKETHNAIKLFNANFGNLRTLHFNIRGKYRDLIKRAIASDRNLPGFSDKPVGTTGARGTEYFYGNGTASDADMRNIIGPATESIPLADRFAFVEFAITNGLTSSICMGINGLVNLVNAGNSTQFFDEHSAGCMPGTYINISYNLALSACLYELINQLKAKGIYEHTVIDVGGEFGRIPQANGGGSDHSAEATSNTLFSGAIDGSHVVGNIVPNDGGQPGTWGFQGVNPEFGLLNVGHFGASLASIIGAQSPVTAVPSIMELKPNGKFVPRLPTGKIV